MFNFYSGYRACSYEYFILRHQTSISTSRWDRDSSVNFHSWPSGCRIWNTFIFAKFQYKQYFFTYIFQNWRCALNTHQNIGLAFWNKFSLSLLIICNLLINEWRKNKRKNLYNLHIHKFFSMTSLICSVYKLLFSNNIFVVLIC